MDLSRPYKASELAEMIGVRLIGKADLLVTGINEIHKVRRGDLTFVDFEKYYSKALISAASCIIIDKEVDCPEGKALLVSENPFRDFNKLTMHFRPFEPMMKNISDTATIGEGTIVMAGAVIGNHVAIGKNSLIFPNVTIYDHAIIGDNVVIHAGAVIGADAFYFKTWKGDPPFREKLYSCGRVIIENDVEIGACCTIDRGESGDTIIGEGTKMDNHIHIGHGTVIGKSCLFAGQVGIGGIVTIGNNVILWGQVGVSKDLTIGDNAIVLAQSGVKDSIEGGKTYFGSPVEEARKMMKQIAMMKSLNDIWNKMKRSD